MLKVSRVMGRANCYSSSILRCVNNVSYKLYSTAPSFKDVMLDRQSETMRTVVVKLDNVESGSNAYNYCKQFGEIKKAIAYTVDEKQHNVLMEYENEESAQEAFKYCGYENGAIPWPNRYMKLNTSALKDANLKDTHLEQGTIFRQSVADLLKEANSVDEQISLLYQHSRLNDLSIRIRFLGAMQVQNVLKGFLSYIFPNARVYPFGSSLNGYGRMGCDLDMVLRFDKDNRAMTVNPDSPIEFLGKEHPDVPTEDMTTLDGRRIKCIGSFLDYFLPGLDKMSAYCNARVPIVRFTDTNIDNVIDLSVNNLDSFQITELMYTLGTFDERVKPFVFLVRTWEKEFKERAFNSREYFTNFQLTYMALSFLQQVKEPILPTYDEILKQLALNDTDLIDSRSDKDFFLDLSRIQFKSKNTSTVPELFCQFLEYFFKFNFAENMITLKTTEILPKVEAWPLYLDNVFVKNTGWGDTVTEFECNYFKVKCEEALNDLIKSQHRTGDEAWGLLKIMPQLK